MKTAREFLSLTKSELGAMLSGGHAIDPSALDDSEYRGVSLGLPGPIVALTWLTFRKTFHRDPQTKRLRGWNVRMEQTGLDGARVPQRSRGEPICFGHYEVGPVAGRGSPIPCDQGLLIDYGRGANGRLDPVRRARDHAAPRAPRDGSRAARGRRRTGCRRGARRAGAAARARASSRAR